MHVRRDLGRLPRVLLLVAAAVGGLTFGCRNADVVGGSCRDDHDCVEECVKGNKFPDGSCTVACIDDFDCPGYAACVDEEGGICLPVCGHDSDCRDQYECKDVDREGAAGKIGVCIH
jgi:hypothetical protein